LETYELLLLPIYIVILTGIASILKRKATIDGQTKYFYLALFTKFAFAIIAGLVYKYIYLGGDTYNFYQIAQVYYKCFSEEPNLLFDLFMFEGGGKIIPPNIDHYNIYFYSWYRAETAAFFLSKIAGFFNLFSFNSYFICSLFFGLVAFWGNWHLYLTISRYYPELNKKLALIIMFMPSVCFWSSGIFKDTITFACIGYLTYFVDTFFIRKRRHTVDLFIALVCIYCLNVIKAYVLVCFIGSALLWYSYQVRANIKSAILKTLITPLLILLVMLSLTQVLSVVGESQKKYSIDNMFVTMQTAQNWHAQISQESNTYSLGIYDQSFLGLLTIMPEAIFIAIFRPFIWEAGFGLMLLSALENLIIAYLIFQVIIKKPTKIIAHITNEPILVYCITFTLTLAFMVGTSSYNFGALTRYRVTFVPLLLATAIIVKHKLSIKQQEA
jgi:hypothetical protein